MSDPVRTMRDYVYGEHSTDRNWNNSAEHWEQDKAWLAREFDKLPRPLPPIDTLPWPKTHREIAA